MIFFITMLFLLACVEPWLESGIHKEMLLPIWYVDRSFLHVECCFSQRLGDSGVAVDGRDQFIHRGFQTDSQGSLGD